jgi:hypothetical protein
MTIVDGVPVPVVCVVRVIVMDDCLMPAAVTVRVAMGVVSDVLQLVLVVVVLVAGVDVPLVDVVHVAVVLDARVPAVRSVAVRVPRMDLVLGGGHCSSLL